MNVSKGIIALFIITVIMASGITYAVTQVTTTARITINKPVGVSFGVRWEDRDIDQEQNVTGVTRLNADTFKGYRVNISGDMINDGSQDLTLTWSTSNVPSGLVVRLYVDGVEWVDSMVIPRSTSAFLTVDCVDDGTLAVGSSVFDLTIVAQ